MYHLTHLYDKQDCVQRISIEAIEEPESAAGELKRNFTPEVSDLVRTVMPNTRIKTLKNPAEALNL